MLVGSCEPGREGLMAWLTGPGRLGRILLVVCLTASGLAALTCISPAVAVA